jgi:hypothetical protein
MLRASVWASRKPQSERQTSSHQHRGRRPDSRPGNGALLRNRAIGVHVPCTNALRYPNGHTVPWRSALAANVGRRPDDQYNDSDNQAQQQSEKQTDKAATFPCGHGKRIDEVSSRENATDLGRRNIGIGSTPSRSCTSRSGRAVFQQMRGTGICAVLIRHEAACTSPSTRCRCRRLAHRAERLRHLPVPRSRTPS